MKPVPDCRCKHCVPVDKPIPVRLDGPWYFGNDAGIPEGQGQRSDLVAVKRALDEGKPMKFIADNFFGDYLRYSKGMYSYKRLCTEPRDHEMEIIVCVGATGTGKSRWVHHTFGKSLYTVPHAKGSGCYWDDYDGEETVLIDEMYGNRFTHSFLLDLLDRYDFTVPVHSSSARFNSRRIIMCSNAHPILWYPKVYDASPLGFFRGPLFRRMTQGNSCVIEFTKSAARPAIYTMRCRHFNFEAHNQEF